ncbi:plasmid stabilization protein [Calothrix sp. HK-06]|nr:plasmid stabilization protein [Calothrix sp. HK-06]
MWDLEDTWVYITGQNPLASDRQIAQILDRLPMLAQFPDMGKSQDALLQGLRSFSVKPYIAFYVKIEDAIEILQILHQSRNFES